MGERARDEYAPEEAFADAIRRAVPDPAGAEAAASAVLCTLVRRMDPERGREVSERLPLRLRRILSCCPEHRVGSSHGGDLVAEVAEHLSVPAAEAEGVTRAVLRAARALAGDAARDVERALPPDAAALWNG